MNERNVAALAELLEAIPGEFVGKHKHQADITIDDLTLEQIARALAARGVLVPAALTDEDCRAVDLESHDYEDDLVPVGMRDALEGIAKGDPGDYTVRSARGDGA